MVSRQLGHESPAVTGRVYVGLFDDAADEVMERLDRRHSEVSSLGTRATVLAPVGVRHISAG
jgi:hypothetical protein